MNMMFGVKVKPDTVIETVFMFEPLSVIKFRFPPEATDPEANFLAVTFPATPKILAPLKIFPAAKSGSPKTVPPE